MQLIHSNHLLTLIFEIPKMRLDVILVYSLITLITIHKPTTPHAITSIKHIGKIKVSRLMLASITNHFHLLLDLLLHCFYRGDLHFFWRRSILFINPFAVYPNSAGTSESIVTLKMRCVILRIY